MLHRIISVKLYTNPRKFHPLCRLVPVHKCNLPLLSDNYNTSNYLLAEISLILRPIHNVLRSGFVVVFWLSFFLKRKPFVTLHKILFYQI